MIGRKRRFRRESKRETVSAREREKKREGCVHASAHTERQAGRWTERMEREKARKCIHAYVHKYA